MNKATPVLIALVVLGTAWLASATQDNDITPNGAANMTRPCAYHTQLNYTVPTSTGSSAQSTANPGSKAPWRVVCSTDTYYAQGLGPTAPSPSGPWFTANLPEWVVLRPSDRLAFRAVASDGKCVVTECR